jgi:hypothetical protein
MDGLENIHLRPAMVDRWGFGAAAEFDALISAISDKAFKGELQP